VRYIKCSTFTFTFLYILTLISYTRLRYVRNVDREELITVTKPPSQFRSVLIVQIGSVVVIVPICLHIQHFIGVHTFFEDIRKTNLYFLVHDTQSIASFSDPYA